MKFNKKKVFALALAICMIAILSFSTLAWFSDSDSVTNEFYLADSTQDPDNIFSVDVWEEVPDGDDEGEDPDKVGEGSNEDTDPEDGHRYDNILPGDNLLKTVHVENTGSYEQYIRVKVTIDDATPWIEMLRKYQIEDLATIFEGYNPELWDRETAENAWDEETDKLTYVFYLKDTLAVDEDVTLFDSVKIPSQLTDEDMAAISHGVFTLNIVAEAVQTNNLGDGVDTAQEAFAVVTADQAI